jgi:hypothetical protein
MSEQFRSKEKQVYIRPSVTRVQVDPVTDLLATCARQSQGAGCGEDPGNYTS